VARPTLVLLPGLLNTRKVFEPVIAALGDAADVIVPELYQCESIDGMAEAALGLAPERFALGGFSMGGYVAFEMLRRAPSASSGWP
jgi:pimeloyl-ACP methyl ester carboxylesterase